jgi:hypothetical protein
MTSTIADWNGKKIGLPRPLWMMFGNGDAGVGHQPTGRPPVSRPEAREAHLAKMRHQATMRDLGGHVCEAPADWRGEGLIRVGKSDANIGRAIVVGQHQKGIARAGVSSEYRGGGA